MTQAGRSSLTLAIPAPTGPYEELHTDLAYAMSSGAFSRCQLSVRSSSGVTWGGNDRTAFARAMDVVQGAGLDFVASIACYQDDSNTNESDAVWQYAGRRREMKLTRICPHHCSRSDALAQLVEESLAQAAVCHLSYFRFEHFYQCVAPQCMTAFEQHTGVEDESELRGPSWLLDPNILPRWVDWRQRVLAKALANLSARAKRRLSIEIDWDRTKHYLGGPEVEEGLRLARLYPHIAEVYVHIEPYEPTSVKGEATRAGQRESYLRQLANLTTTAKSAGIDTHFFFWGLDTKDDIDRQLPIYLGLVNAVGPSGAVLYTRRPRELATALAGHWL